MVHCKNHPKMCQSLPSILVLYLDFKSYCYYCFMTKDKNIAEEVRQLYSFKDLPMGLKISLVKQAII